MRALATDVDVQSAWTDACVAPMATSVSRKVAAILKGSTGADKAPETGLRSDPINYKDSLDHRNFMVAVMDSPCFSPAFLLELSSRLDLPIHPRFLVATDDLNARTGEARRDNNSLPWDAPRGDIVLLREACSVENPAPRRVATNVPHLVRAGTLDYDWGHVGPGARALAANILNQFVPPQSDGVIARREDAGDISELSWTARALRNDFAREILAPLHRGHALISGERIAAWIVQKVAAIADKPRWDQLLSSEGSVRSTMWEGGAGTSLSEATIPALPRIEVGAFVFGDRQKAPV